MLAFLKQHTTIKTKAVLLLYAVIVFYNVVFYLFQFSLLRFLKAGIGKEFFIIGLIFALSNFVAIFMDIPLGVLQRYVKPRRFFLAAVVLMLMSDLIFLFASLNFWLAFVAVFLYQLSGEVFMITITTYILKLSNARDYAQNLAQADIADNTGQVIGLSLGGLVFFIDRFLAANNLFVISLLVLLITFVFLFVYEFFNREHYSDLEQEILSRQLPQQVITSVEKMSDQLVIDAQSSPPVEPERQEEGTFSWTEVMEKFQTTFDRMVHIFTSRTSAPILIWSIVILVVTAFWYESITFFEPFFVRDVFEAGRGWIADNIPRYLFESLMFIAAIVIPTFFLEMPFSRLADEWGKEKMVIVGTFFSGAAIFFLGFFQTPFIVFLTFLAVNCGFVIIYPALVGLFGEEYKKATSLPGPGDMPDVNQQSSEGDSAGLVAIIMNVGQVMAGLVGGALIEYFAFGTTFFLYGLLLILIGIGSVFFLKSNLLSAFHTSHPNSNHESPSAN